MPKRRPQSAADDEQASAPSFATPEPAGDLRASFTELAIGTVLHRVHQARYNAQATDRHREGSVSCDPQVGRGAPPPVSAGAWTVLGVEAGRFGARRDALRGSHP